MMAGKISSTWKAVKFILIVRSSFDRVICFSRFLKYYFVRRRTSVFPFLFSRGSFFLLIITKRDQGLIIARSFWRHLENKSPRTKVPRCFVSIIKNGKSNTIPRAGFCGSRLPGNHTQYTEIYHETETKPGDGSCLLDPGEWSKGTGRPGEARQNQEIPDITGRVGRYENNIFYLKG